MFISKKINSMLKYIGLAVVRRSTVERFLEINNTDFLDKKHKIIEDRIERLGKDFSSFENNILRHQIAEKWSIVDYFSRNFNDPNRLCSCPLCGFSAKINALKQFTSNCIFGGGVLVRYQCQNCDLIFGPDKMLDLSPLELSGDYEWHYKVYKEGDSTSQEIRAFHALNPSKSGIYLNYGAGAWSKSVQVLRNEGWNVMAYEPHGSAQENSNYVISSSEDLKKIKFDGIFSNNVLEHLRYPIDELVFMRGIIKPGGRMSHATPCFEYLYEHTRFHLFFYLGRSRALLAEKSNLNIVDFILDGEFMCSLYEEKRI